MGAIAALCRLMVSELLLCWLLGFNQFKALLGQLFIVFRAFIDIKLCKTPLHFSLIRFVIAHLRANDGLCWARWLRWMCASQNGCAKKDVNCKLL